MKTIRHFLFVLSFSAVMFFSFLQQEEFFNSRMQMVRAMPSEILRISLGFFSEIGAELLFAHNAAFIGGKNVVLKEGRNADVLLYNFEICARLYPEFVDPYYMSEGILPPIGYRYASGTNVILDVGIASEPTNMIYRFFKGVNFFYYMDEPLQASAFFRESAKLTGAPPLFAHLSAILAAQGGELHAGLTSLQLLMRSESDEIVRQRYKEEMEIFREAIRLQEAVFSYMKKFDVAPEKLEDLTPDFVLELPKDTHFFRFSYSPPKVKLLRPK